MLSDRKDYYWYKGNAIKRIAIEGKPYPVRPEKLVPLGEDEAYIQEAVCERKHLFGRGATYFYTPYVLNVWKNRRSPGEWDDWVYTQISSELHTVYDAEKIRNFRISNGLIVKWHGRVTSGSGGSSATGDHETQGIEKMIKIGNDTFNAILEKRQSVNVTYDELLREFNDTVYDKYKQAYEIEEDANKEYRDKVEELDSKRIDELAALGRRLESQEKEIAEKYSEDPPEDVDEQEWERRRSLELWNAQVAYYRDVEKCNRTWQAEVGKAGRERDKTVSDMESELRSFALDKWYQHIEECNDLYKKTVDWRIKICEERNSRITGILQGLVSEYAYIVAENYLYGRCPIDKDRAAIESEGLSCLDHYLRRTPAPGITFTIPTLGFVCIGMSSNALVRMYADLEMRNARLAGLPVYRAAHDVEEVKTINDKVIYRIDDHVGEIGIGASRIAYWLTNTERKHDKDHKEGVLVTTVTEETYSNFDFCLYYGSRYEVENDVVQEMYMTLLLRINESVSIHLDEGDSVYEAGRIVRAMRVKLENKGVQGAEYLKQLDEIDDKLEEDIAKAEEERDKDLKDILDAYYKACADADSAYEEALDKATVKYNGDVSKSHMDYFDKASALAADTNTRLWETENSDLDDNEIIHRKAEIIEAFEKSLAQMQKQESDRKSSLTDEYNDRREALRRNRNKLYDDALAEKNDKTAKREEEYGDAVSELRDGAKDKKDAVYSAASRNNVRLRPDARCKWGFTLEEVDERQLSVDTPSHIGDSVTYSYFATVESMYSESGGEAVDIIYKPKSSTGMDYRKFKEEAEKGYERPRKYYRAVLPYFARYY